MRVYLCLLGIGFVLVLTRGDFARAETPPPTPPPAPEAAPPAPAGSAAVTPAAAAAPSEPEAAPTAPLPVKARLVGVILDTGQALLWDETLGKYALREAGEEFQGQRILAIEKDRIQLEHTTLELTGAPILSRRPPRKLPALIVTGTTEGHIEKVTPATAEPAHVSKAEPATREISRAELEGELRDFSQIARGLALEPAPAAAGRSCASPGAACSIGSGCATATLCAGSPTCRSTTSTTLPAPTRACEPVIT
jgi:hypothetical protein